jgi:hypothetical protein
VVEDLICATTSSGSGRIVDDVFCVSCPDMYSMLLFILCVPSKGVVQGGRHLSLEQSRLSKDANIDISVGKMPMCDGRIVICTRREDGVPVVRSEKGNYHDVTKLLAFDHFPFFQSPLFLPQQCTMPFPSPTPTLMSAT